MPAPPHARQPRPGAPPPRGCRQETRIAAAVATPSKGASAVARPRPTRALVQWYLLLIVVAAAAFAATNFVAIGDLTIGMWSAVLCVVGVIIVAFLALTNRS